jgi:hypothetical protein
VNGAPCSGKSTLARMYAAEHPLVLALDIDVVRAMLGRWLERPMEAGLIARRMAIEMARVQLSGGRDVLVPQFLGRLDFVLELEELCTQVGAEFVEVALLSSPQDAADRFLRRAHHPETSAHRPWTGGDAGLQGSRQMHRRGWPRRWCLTGRPGGRSQVPRMVGQGRSGSVASW